MKPSTHKPLMRSIGEFFGHIIHGVRSAPDRTVVKKTVHEEERGDITLRRTTIEEIELRRDDRKRGERM